MKILYSFRKWMTCITWKPVSYTHLDVYKRQRQYSSSRENYLIVSRPTGTIAIVHNNCNIWSSSSQREITHSLSRTVCAGRGFDSPPRAVKFSDIRSYVGRLQCTYFLSLLYSWRLIYAAISLMTHDNKLSVRAHNQGGTGAGHTQPVNNKVNKYVQQRRRQFTTRGKSFKLTPTSVFVLYMEMKSRQQCLYSVSYTHLDVYKRQ